MIIFIIIVLVLVLLGFYFASIYNELVDLRNKVNDQWSQIDVELKRRFDLIPNLVNTVKGYAKHESETLESVIKARNTYLTAGSREQLVDADDKLSLSIGKLYALVESYPELKECEDKISYARKFYNDMALKLNNKIEMFPSNIVANMFKFTKIDYFKANDAERENVKVEF